MTQSHQEYPSELTVSQSIEEIQRQQQEIQRYQREIQNLQAGMQEHLDNLMNAATLEEYTENQCNILVQVARRGIELLQLMDKGDVITLEWIALRDRLVKDAERLIDDVPPPAR